MNNKGMGALESPKDLRDYRLNTVAMAIDLPTEFILNHSHIKDQGMVGSCVAHSLSEVLETQDNINYSTGWIYGYRPENYYQGMGMYISEALKTIKNIGYVLNQDYDCNVEMMEAKWDVDRNLEILTNLAKNKKIKAYAKLFGENEIKQALYSSKTPIILAIGVGNEGLLLNNEYIAQIPEKPINGHALVCYGWNEKGFLIQNSWGEEWGDNGTFILPYNYPLREAWCLQFFDIPKEEDELIVKPKYYGFRKILMSIIKILKNIF